MDPQDLNLGVGLVLGCVQTEFTTIPPQPGILEAGAEGPGLGEECVGVEHTDLALQVLWFVSFS